MVSRKTSPVLMIKLLKIRHNILAIVKIMAYETICPTMIIEKPISRPVSIIVNALTSIASLKPKHSMITKKSAVIGLTFGKALILNLGTQERAVKIASLVNLFIGIGLLYL